MALQKLLSPGTMSRSPTPLSVYYTPLSHFGNRHPFRIKPPFFFANVPLLFYKNMSHFPLKVIFFLPTFSY